MVGPVLAEVSAFEEVLAEEAVGVLVGASLPGLGGVTEVDLETNGDLDLGVVAHLHALVPGERLPEEPGQLLGGCDHRLLDLEGGVAIGQMEEHHKARRALDQGADGGLARLSDNQVALPVSGYRPVLDLSWTLADVDHVRNPRLALVALASGL